LPCVGLPAVLVPYPFAWRFQKTNAQHLSSRGAAIMLEDGAMADQLVGRVLDLLGDRDALASMRAASRAAARCDGARRIADVVMEVVRD
jgi:UDP-N-acetylglucosamine--N-acetylmuramyl-(pentapeptide) pyrophosphoryl-undecaprenol N-acetylglucosamine transferase